LHLYHCHIFPLARHIAKGLYGAFIVDPKQGRPSVDREMVMVMSGFDVDFDDDNDFYAVNAIPFHYQNYPIQIKVAKRSITRQHPRIRFDQLLPSSCEFFQFYLTGTSSRGWNSRHHHSGTGTARHSEFSYKYPGMYTFHAHVTEFAELGWNGMLKFWLDIKVYHDLNNRLLPRFSIKTLGLLLPPSLSGVIAPFNTGGGASISNPRPCRSNH
jgi:hypothetical protein